MGEWLASPLRDLSARNNGKACQADVDESQVACKRIAVASCCKV